MRFLLAVLPLFALFPQAAAAKPLVPPFDVAAIRAAAGQENKDKFKCGVPPKPLRNLHFESMYEANDKTRSTVDPAAEAAYKKAYKPAADFEQALGHMASRYTRSSPPRNDMAACALGWMHDWAQAGALLGDVNRSGEFIRKWLLASIANDWLQIRGAEGLDEDKKEAVLDWIRKVAEAAQADFSRDTEKNSRRNNHMYWAAWGVASAAIALDDRDMFNWSMAAARIGINEIDESGVLPLELDRAKRACLYHNFAALPLFMLAEAGARNGIDMFGARDKALQRLGALNLKNARDCAGFADLTGSEQDTKRAATSSNMGWVEIYDRHYPGDPLSKATIERLRPFKNSRMGGDITLLYGLKTVKDKP